MSRSDKIDKVAIIVDGYPRLYETDVAQEIHALEQRGISLEIWALRSPNGGIVNPIHKKITTPVFYIPEALFKIPFRVIGALLWAIQQQGFSPLIRTFWRDLRKDFTVGRLRSLGRALILARALDKTTKHVHACFLQDAGTLAFYAALLTNRHWSFSVHDKDIGTMPEWEKQAKVKAAEWGVAGCERDVSDLRALTSTPDKISLVSQGIDTSFFSSPIQPRPARDGTSSTDPLRILSIGRASPEKGLDDLIRALSALPKNLHWHYVHIGGGKTLNALKQRAKDHQLDHRILFLGPRNQTDILHLLREADLFVLPSKNEQSNDQGRAPTVMMEAASQKLAIITTSVTHNRHFIRHGQEGILVPPDDWESLSNAINLLGRDPQQRSALGEAAYQRLQQDDFLQENTLDALANRFHRSITL